MSADLPHIFRGVRVRRRADSLLSTVGDWNGEAVYCTLLKDENKRNLSWRQKLNVAHNENTREFDILKQITFYKLII